MKSYCILLQDVSDWFRTNQGKHADQIRCARGCVKCCYGLFNISLSDALFVSMGMSALPPATRSAVTARAAEIHKKIVRQAPELQAPYLLHTTEDAVIDRIEARMSNARCPFLGAGDECLVYEHRPLACRLEGTPMVDKRDGLFGDWCELNFNDGVSATDQSDLTFDYYGLQKIETASARELSELLLGESLEAATIFMPSLIVEYETFWAWQLEKCKLADFQIVQS